MVEWLMPSFIRAHRSIGVPRVLDNTLPAHLASNPEDPEWDPFASFMQTTRINVNVRQVFPKAFDPTEAMKR